MNVDPRFEAGVAVRRITPEGSVPLAGYAARRQWSIGVNDDLFSHGLVVSDGREVAAIVSLDLVEVSQELVESIRNEVERRLGLPASGIMVCATHTHSGPVVTPGFGEQPDPSYVRFVAQQAVAVLADAWAHRTPASVRTGSGKAAGVAFDRRTLAPSPDPEVGVIGVYRGAELVGSIVNFALHPTVLGAENLMISSDWPAYLRKAIERRYPGCITLFVNGAAGNINIGYSADDSALGKRMAIRTFETAQRVGECVASVALDALAKAATLEEPRVEVRSRDAVLPLKKLPSRQELARRVMEADTLIREAESTMDSSRAREQRLRMVYDQCLLHAMDRLRIEGKADLQVSLQAIRIGDAVLVGIPGELFAELGLEIKRAGHRYRVWVAGYANGSIGYLPTPEAYRSGGYEVETSVFSELAAGVLTGEAQALVRSFA